MGTIYENGTVLSQKERRTLRRSADSAKSHVMNFFNSTSKAYTAEDIHAALFPTGLLTSTRRTLSTLLYEDFLVKGDRRMGSKGVKIVTYKRNKPEFHVEPAPVVKPSKTILEWLKELPEPYAQQAIANTDMDVLHSHEPSLDKSLKRAFVWNTTSQGYMYWVDLYNKLFERETP